MKTASQRRAAAAEIAAICALRGAQAHVGPMLFNERHGLTVFIRTRRSLCVRVDLNGKRCGEAWVLPWHMEGATSARLSAEFSPEVNPYHRQKATVVRSHWADVLHEVDRGLRMAADGSAFEQPQEVAA